MRKDSTAADALTTPSALAGDLQPTLSSETTQPLQPTLTPTLTDDSQPLGDLQPLLPFAAQPAH